MAVTAGVLSLLRKALDELLQTGRVAYGVFGTGILVEMLVSVAPRVTWPKPKRRSTGWRTCRTTIRRRGIWLLRLRALLAGARGDDAAYRDLATRYRATAESLGFEGHIDWAEAMMDGQV